MRSAKGARGSGFRKRAEPPRITRGSRGPAVPGTERDAGQAEDLEDVEVVVLEGDREGHRVEIPERRVGLEAREGPAGALELGLLGVVRQEGPLAGHVGHPAEHPVDALEAQVRHPDEVQVRVHDGHPPRARERHAPRGTPRPREGTGAVRSVDGTWCSNLRPRARPDLLFYTFWYKFPGQAEAGRRGPTAVGNGPRPSRKWARGRPWRRRHRRDERLRGRRPARSRARRVRRGREPRERDPLRRGRSLPWG